MLKKISFRKANKDLFQDVLTNGLKIIVAPMPLAKTVTIGLYIDRGGLARDFSIGKQKIYPGTAYLTANSLIADHKAVSDPLFGDDCKLRINVEESYTTYSASVSADKAISMIDPLLSLVDSFDISNDNADKLKKPYLDKIQADKSPYDLLRSKLYEFPPMGVSMNPDQESIKKVHQIAMHKFFDNFYTVDNMTLIVAGNIDPKVAHDKAEAHKFPQRGRSELISVKEYKENYKKAFVPASSTLDKNTLLVGIKMPLRHEVFNLFGDESFACYRIISAALFSFKNSRAKEILKDALIVKESGIRQGGEDAFLYQSFETGNPQELAKQIDKLLSLKKVLLKRDFRSIKKEYLTKSLNDYRENSDAYMTWLFEAYADRYAEPAIIEMVQKLKYSHFIKLLNSFCTFPRSIITSQEEKQN